MKEDVISSDSRISRGIFGLAVMLGLGFGGVAEAQRPPADDLRWSLGIGVISSPRPYVGASNSTRPVPLLELSYKSFFVQGIRLGVRATEAGAFTLNIVAGPRFLGYEEDDSRFLRGMAERKMSIDIGVSAAWNRPRYGAVAWARRDVSGHSEGFQAGADVFLIRSYFDGRLRLQPGLGLEWQDDNTVDYYYGVRPEEARPDRPAYRAGSNLGVSGDLLAFYRISSRISLVSLLRLKALGDEITDSPIVDRELSYFGLLGLSYTF